MNSLNNAFQEAWESWLGGLTLIAAAGLLVLAVLFEWLEPLAAAALIGGVATIGATVVVSFAATAMARTSAARAMLRGGAIVLLAVGAAGLWSVIASVEPVAQAEAKVTGDALTLPFTPMSVGSDGFVTVSARPVKLAPKRLQVALFWRGEVNATATRDQATFQLGGQGKKGPPSFAEQALARRPPAGATTLAVGKIEPSDSATVLLEAVRWAVDPRLLSLIALPFALLIIVSEARSVPRHTHTHAAAGAGAIVVLLWVLGEGLTAGSAVLSMAADVGVAALVGGIPGALLRELIRGRKPATGGRMQEPASND